MFGDKLRVVLVEPEYEQNIGYCARVMKNFGFSDLWVVKPETKIGKEAIMYAKHAREVLERAKIVKSLKEATRGHLVVGTTAVTPSGRDITRISIHPREIKNIKERIALLVGREGTGLSKEELRQCDIVVRIPTDKKYPTLNISHALAIILYELGGREKEEEEIKERKMIIELFDKLVEKMKGVRSPSTIRLAFRRIAARGIRNSTEARALLKALKSI